jgi:hypothetical protein
MFEGAGRRVGVTLPEGQGQERAREPNKVLFIGEPLEIRPFQYTDEYARVHNTFIYVVKDENGQDDAYLYPPTEEAVKGYRRVTPTIKRQIELLIVRDNAEVPKEDTVDVVAQDIAEKPQVDITAGEQPSDESPQASQ